MDPLQVTFCLCSLLLTCLALTYVLTRAKPVYLRDFHVFKAPDECAPPRPCRWLLQSSSCADRTPPSDSSLTQSLTMCRLKITHDMFVELSKKSGVFSDNAMQFQERIMEKSGLGDETYLPPGKQVLGSAPQRLACLLSQQASAGQALRSTYVRLGICISTTAPDLLSCRRADLAARHQHAQRAGGGRNGDL